MEMLQWQSGDNITQMGSKVGIACIAEAGTQPYGHAPMGQAHSGELEVCVLVDGQLHFTFYVTTSTEQTEYLYIAKLQTVEAARQYADTIMSYLENATDQWWADMGFTKYVF